MPWMDSVKRIFGTTKAPADTAPVSPTKVDIQPKVKSNTTADRPTSDSFDVKPAGVRPADAVDATANVAAPTAPRAKEIAAVIEFRRLIDKGELNKYYNAAIGVTEDAELAAKAMALFKSLPKINSRIRAEELVELKLWTKAPEGIDAMLKSPRYLPGRRLLVPTYLNSDIFAGGNKFLTYLSRDEGGKLGVTSRAVLMGEKGNDFLVKVDGSEELVTVSKRDVYKFNHPTTFERRNDPDHLSVGSGGQVFGQTDYTDPLTKAKVCEAAIGMDSIVGKINFTKALEGGVMGQSSEAKEVVRLQQQAVGAVHRVINMTYYHGKGDEERMKADKRPHAAYVSAGRAAVKGTGKCHDHACVNLGILTPFASILGVDVKMFYGHCYRGVEKYGVDEKLPSDISRSSLLESSDGKYLYENPFEFHAQRNRDYATKEIKKKADGRPDVESTGHSWLHLSFRPALNDERVCDQTWGQPNKEADSAYTTKWGDRYPTRSWFIPDLQPVQPTDSNFTGHVVVNTPGVTFGQQGDGRENHIGKRPA